SSVGALAMCTSGLASGLKTSAIGGMFRQNSASAVIVVSVHRGVGDTTLSPAEQGRCSRLDKFFACFGHWRQASGNAPKPPSDGPAGRLLAWVGSTHAATGAS